LGGLLEQKGRLCFSFNKRRKEKYLYGGIVGSGTSPKKLPAIIFFYRSLCTIKIAVYPRVKNDEQRWVAKKPEPVSDQEIQIPDLTPAIR
jgi:hypothetical protein